jgi:hypothetical protein
MNIVDFAKQYEEVDARAKELFTVLEDLEKEYSKKADKPNRYRYYDYDRFEINGCHIELFGSYSYSGDWGKNSYTMTLEEFSTGSIIGLHREKLEARYQQSLIRSQILKEEQEVAEKAMLKGLLEKYGNKNEKYT